MWVTIILQAVVPILIKLIQAWMANHGKTALSHELKEEFLTQVSKHPKLHAKRMAVAEALFNRVADDHERQKLSTEAAEGANYAGDLVRGAAAHVEAQFAHTSEDDPE